MTVCVCGSIWLLPAFLRSKLAVHFFQRIEHFSAFVAITLVCSSIYADTLSDYRLGSGDSIKITVFDEPDLSLEIGISGKGTVSYPFLGELEVSGLTVSQLEAKIADGLKGDYLVEPRVSVSIALYRQFYINGEVEAPGGFPYLPRITLRKAIALAGGFTERASKNKIFVIHDHVEIKNGRGQLIGLDELITPGDIITVEQSFF